MRLNEILLVFILLSRYVQVFWKLGNVFLRLYIRLFVVMILDEFLKRRHVVNVDPLFLICGSYRKVTGYYLRPSLNHQSLS